MAEIMSTGVKGVSSIAAQVRSENGMIHIEGAGDGGHCCCVLQPSGPSGLICRDL